MTSNDGKIKNETEAAYYMAAMIDGEGCVVHSGHTRNVNIVNTDQDIIEAIKTCYDILGISYRIQKMKVYQDHHKPRWSVITTRREHLQTILDKVPIQTARKVEKLKIALESYRPVVRPDAEVLRRMYLDEKKGSTQIGRELGFGPSSIIYWLRSDGIEFRSQAESARLRYAAGLARPEDAKRAWLYDQKKEAS